MHKAICSVYYPKRETARDQEITKEKMQEMSTKMQLQWRRRQVLELSSKGQSQIEIAKTLQISESTISRDLDYLKKQAKENIKKYIDERLPEEYEKCLVGLTAILREAWNTSQQTEDKREKIQALSLAKECYSMKLDLLTNATVVEDAIRFVYEKSKDKDREQVKRSPSTSSSDSRNEDNKESKEPDYGEDKGKLEEKQEEESGETTAATTTNQVFS
jgi:DNA-binding CsgD family transcriptional regulator